MQSIPLAIPDVGAREMVNLRSCIEENFVSTVGRFVTEFETRCAQVSGVEHGVAMGSGTMALHMALRSLDIGAGDLVICPSFTFVASAASIRHANATPWLMDAGPDDWTLDPARMEQALERDCELRDGMCIHRPTGFRVAAVMPVYTVGLPADMERIGAIARRWRLRVIADAAAAIGASCQDRPLGLWADATCFSFNGNKTVTCGGGGALVTSCPDLARRAKHLSTTARSSPDYEFDEVGFNYRMTNVEAAIGCAQMDRLSAFLAAKRRVRDHYNRAFGSVVGLSLFPEPANRVSACWFSGFVFETDPAPDTRAFCAALAAEGIGARTFWKPIHLQQPYRDHPAEQMPVSSRLWSRIVTLPCSTSITDNELEQVTAAVRRQLARIGIGQET